MSQRLAYPHTPSEEVSELLHGREIADPHRWLEDPTDPRREEWIDAQNALTQAWLEPVPAREEIRARLRKLWDYPRRSVPWRRGQAWLQLRNTGLQDQDVLWVADAPEADGRVLLDPNALSLDGTSALTGVSMSDDGQLLAYAVSEQGSDWRTWRVREVATGQDLPDRLLWSKFTDATWHPDGSGFWYGVFDPPDAQEAVYEAATRGQRLMFHRLGTAQASDELVAELPEDPAWMFATEVTTDHRWLVVTLHRGTDPRNRVWVADLQADGPLEPLLDDFDAGYQLVGSDGSSLHLLTDAQAPRSRVIAVDARSGAVREVVPEGEHTLERARIVGGRLLTVWLVDAVSRMRRHHLDGTPDGEVALPALGSLGALAGEQDDDVLHYSFTSFTQAPAVYAYDVAADESALLFAPELDFDSDALVTEQAFARSADGTSVPLFLVHRRDVRPTAGDGDRGHPTLLWGYGGFHIPVSPTFKVPWVVWVERGGVLAVANLRGGGEYGQQWHDSGRLDSKQRVFDDAIACGEHLGAQGWTSPARLAVTGGSNGGLMAAGCLTQRPDAFGAAVVEVGVLDMLRFHLSTIGWAWMSDYGDPEDPDAFATLLSYSPLHNVAPGTAYPATLLTTGDHDDRVVPWHSFKLAAALQAAQGGDEPVLLRVDRSGGHGMGKPTAKVIDERADVLAFLERALRVC